MAETRSQNGVHFAHIFRQGRTVSLNVAVFSNLFGIGKIEMGIFGEKDIHDG